MQIVQWSPCYLSFFKGKTQVKTALGPKHVKSPIPWSGLQLTHMIQTTAVSRLSLVLAVRTRVELMHSIFKLATCDVNIAYMILQHSLMVG